MKNETVHQEYEVRTARDGEWVPLATHEACHEGRQEAERVARAAATSHGVVARVVMVTTHEAVVFESVPGETDGPDGLGALLDHVRGYIREGEDINVAEDLLVRCEGVLSKLTGDSPVGAFYVVEG